MEESEKYICQSELIVQFSFIVINKNATKRCIVIYSNYFLITVLQRIKVSTFPIEILEIIDFHR